MAIIKIGNYSVELTLDEVMQLEAMQKPEEKKQVVGLIDKNGDREDVCVVPTIHASKNDVHVVSVSKKERLRFLRGITIKTKDGKKTTYSEIRLIENDYPEIRSQDLSGFNCHGLHNNTYESAMRWLARKFYQKLSPEHRNVMSITRLDSNGASYTAVLDDNGVCVDVVKKESRLNFFTIQETAKALKVGLRTIYNWNKAGRIAFVQLGKGNFRVRKEELERFISAGKPDQSVKK